MESFEKRGFCRLRCVVKNELNHWKGKYYVSDFFCIRTDRRLALLSGRYSV